MAEGCVCLCRAFVSIVKGAAGGQEISAGRNRTQTVSEVKYVSDNQDTGYRSVSESAYAAEHILLAGGLAIGIPDVSGSVGA